MVTISKRDIGKRIINKSGGVGDIIEFVEGREFAVIVVMLDGSRMTYTESGRYYSKEDSDLDVERVIEKPMDKFDAMNHLDATDYFQKIMSW